MRRIAVAIMSTISGLVLLFSYHTSTNSGAVAAASAQPANGTAATPATGLGGAAQAAGTYTGASISTRWGPVQVQITVQDGKITRAPAVQYPTSNSRDQQINSYAVPVLNQQTVQQQSADIDTVSGATVTSDGYAQSLQSAIDQAHLS